MRKKGSPSIKDVISDFMTRNRSREYSFQEIYEHVQEAIGLTSKTPRNSVFSVLVRMADVERVGRGTYRLMRHKGAAVLNK
jgi:hypothetical protein